MGYYAAYTFLYSKWHSESINISDLENYYLTLSKEYGYKFGVLEGEMNSLGYQLLFGVKAEESIIVFKKNAESFPGDPNLTYMTAWEMPIRLSENLTSQKLIIQKGCELGKKQNNVNFSSYCNYLFEFSKMLDKK